jgi:hypothetical protein
VKERAIKKTVYPRTEYVKARQALLTEGLVRSFKSPEVDFSERLVAIVFNGELPDSKCNPGYDVIAGDKRIQVKSVAKAPGNKNGYIIRDKDRANNSKTGATHYAFVFFDELIPTGIFLVPEDFVRQFAGTQIKRHHLEKTSYRVEIDLDVFKP